MALPFLPQATTPLLQQPPSAYDPGYMSRVIAILNSFFIAQQQAGVSGVRFVDTTTDAISSTDRVVVMNGLTTEKLPVNPQQGQMLYLFNVGSGSTTVDGNGNSIWVAGTSTSTITMATHTTKLLIWDHASSTNVWRAV